MEFYYRFNYPYAYIQRLLNALNPNGCEIAIRTRNDVAPMRDRKPTELSTLLLRFNPLDGAHVSVGSHPSAAFVLDVDNDRKNMPRCSCTEDNRCICDNCWLTMAGILRAYMYVLRAHFGCTLFLPCFSGGRGWHLFVLDSSDIDRTYAMHKLKDLISDALRLVSAPCKTIDGRTLCAFESFKLGSSLLDPMIVSLYRDVMLPFFKTEWIPRILGVDATFNDGLVLASQLVTDNIVATAYRQFSSMPNITAIDERDRLDAFIAITTLLWQSPDSNLCSDNHLLRLPWSPHQRTGNFSLPLHMDWAHTLCPQTRPPKVFEVGKQNTTGNAWFQRSLEVVQDLLDNFERRPRAIIWPA